jgi:hypothetical protein
MPHDVPVTVVGLEPGVRALRMRTCRSCAACFRCLSKPIFTCAEYSLSHSAVYPEGARVGTPTGEETTLLWHVGDSTCLHHHHNERAESTDLELPDAAALPVTGP